MRSLLQFSLYRQASECNPVLLPPVEYGRKLDNDGILVPVMMLKESKPATALPNFHFVSVRKVALRIALVPRLGQYAL